MTCYAKFWQAETKFFGFGMEIIFNCGNCNHYHFCERIEILTNEKHECHVHCRNCGKYNFFRKDGQLLIMGP